MVTNSLFLTSTTRLSRKEPPIKAQIEETEKSINRIPA